MRHDLPVLAELPVPLVVSVMGTSAEEFARLIEGVGGRDEVAALELNVSCPNVKSGLIVGEQPAETLLLLKAVRDLTEKPLIVKLTPNVADPTAVAIAAEEGGADAVSLVNTLKSAPIDPATARALARGRPRRALRARDSADRARPDQRGRRRGIDPGDRDGRDRKRGGRARVRRRRGAAVAVGTANFRDPLAGERVRRELGDSIAARGLSSVAAARGRALPAPVA